MGIRPKKGRRVQWMDYVKEPDKPAYERVTLTGTVLGRVKKISRNSASDSRAYYNIRDVDGRKHRVEPWQLERYVDAPEAEKLATSEE